MRRAKPQPSDNPDVSASASDFAPASPHRELAISNLEIALSQAASLTTAEALTRLGSSQKGLSAEEASRRLSQFGPNAIRSHGVRALAVLLRQLKNPLLPLLVVAATTSMFVGERTNAVIILVMIAL